MKMEKTLSMYIIAGMVSIIIVLLIILFVKISHSSARGFNGMARLVIHNDTQNPEFVILISKRANSSMMGRHMSPGDKIDCGMHQTGDYAIIIPDVNHFHMFSISETGYDCERKNLAGYSKDPVYEFIRNIKLSKCK